MGNRANVIFVNKDESEISPVIYLHWNGGPESIYAFLNEMARRKIRTNDTMYESARFIHIVGDFFDQSTLTGLSLGLTNGPKSITAEELGKINTDSGDNGFFIVSRNVGKKDKVNIKVRRFKACYPNADKNDYTVEIKELTPEEVKKEYGLAIKSEYVKNIAETFIEIQGKRKINDE